MTIQVRVKLFGAAREAAGASAVALELPEAACVADVRTALAGLTPALAKTCGRARLAVNQRVAAETERVHAADEIALLPPVSGGSGRCTLSDAPLDVSAVIARVSGPDVGGIVVFLGTVRDHARGRGVEKLEYEAYPGMAEREMDAIAEEAATRFGDARVAIAHRTGRLAIGEIAVVVVAAASHRPEAFAACRFAIDALKERVPIWKKEFADDGAVWVDDHP